jgi:hypothetical protein
VPVLAPGAPLTDAWVKSMMSWANATLGVVTTERKLRSREHACEDTMAEKGIIR